MSLTACGFHLRGAVDLPPELERTVVVGTAANSPLGRAVRDVVSGAGAQLVGSPEAATGVLRLAEGGFSRRLLTVDRAGRASGYELRYQLAFELLSPTGEVLLPSQSVTVIRDYDFDPDNVISTDEQEAVIRDEMRLRAVRQMVRRVDIGMRNRAIRADPPAVESAEPK